MKPLEFANLEPANLMQPFGLAAPDSDTAPMVDFRGHDGTSFALPYRDLRAIVLPRSDRITLEFADHQVVVRGRNLRPVYDHLVGHRVTFLQEDDFDHASESETFIESIVVERRRVVE